MPRSKIPYFFLALAAALAVAALVMLLLHKRAKPAPPNTATPSTQETPVISKTVPVDDIVTPQDPDVTLKELGLGIATADPAELVNQIAKAFDSGDFATLTRLIDKDALDPRTAERLKLLSAAGLRLRQPNGVREIGELELNVRTRWILELTSQEPGRDQIQLDLRRSNGKWTVEKITLPAVAEAATPEALIPDSLSVVDSFLQAVLKQNFEFARAFVDSTTVSDTKIAGLCILFEEGEYRMRATKPLRAMFQRQDTVGYIANLETTDGKQSAHFAVTMKLTPAPSKWLVSEINLDQLLADYASRVAGGDIYYSPLVKNPAGGDTLALYFEFDEDVINPRTCRQLEIVSLILKSDPGKKLTLSGHTDSLGTEGYNRSLSERRADVVRDFLTSSGVNAAQIVTVAKGSSQPRRPNVTETGVDNPEGRRANRRTEIYLDF
jgi:outer membrane protein OmpA-like peptidoglycan-associated protein